VGATARVVEVACAGDDVELSSEPHAASKQHARTTPRATSRTAL
jgi:hypothetical protein